jgi:hypothetical protein
MRGFPGFQPMSTVRAHHVTGSPNNLCGDLTAYLAYAYNERPKTYVSNGTNTYKDLYIKNVSEKHNTKTQSSD